MGYYKNELIVNNFERPIEYKERIVDKFGECRYCKSNAVDYVKVLGWGKKMGKVYHYKLICTTCGKSYHVKRTKEVFEKVKNTPWIKSKAVKKMEFKQTLC